MTIRARYDANPYPSLPIDTEPRADPTTVFLSSYTTAHYIHSRKFASSEGKVILDAGCGTGFQTLSLAIANPGAKIIAVDLSPASIRIAQQRASAHDIDNIEFRALSFCNLSELSTQFDYIHNFDVLYLNRNPEEILAYFREMLKPSGIIRSNLHCEQQRRQMLQSQELARLAGIEGLTDPQKQLEYFSVLMESIQYNVPLKRRVWRGRKDLDWAVQNPLLFDDKGFSI